MIPSHHPHPETLVAYASGTLPGAVACVVACHLAMCAECAREVRWLERLGGVLLSALDAGDEDAGDVDVVAGWEPEDGTIRVGPVLLRNDAGVIRLLRLSPGQALSCGDLTLEREVALVLEGACRDGADTYLRGDIIAWSEDVHHLPVAAGETECVCLIADQPPG